MAIRIMLADDHQMVCESFRAILAVTPGLEVVAAARDGQEAVRTALETKPDVILMDITMPCLDGEGATRRILKQLPSTRIIALSMHAHRQFVSLMTDAGASGYVLKTCSACELVDAVRRVASGKTYFSPALLSPARTAAAAQIPFSNLTSREREVLKLLADGYATHQIAAQLTMAEKTVATHRANIMKKLKINTVAGLTKYAIREGLSTI